MILLDPRTLTAAAAAANLSAAFLEYRARARKEVCIRFDDSVGLEAEGARTAEQLAALLTVEAAAAALGARA